jgi:hypothetical protein
MEHIALASSDDDVAYVRSAFIRLDDVRDGGALAPLIGTALPMATYRLADGSHWFAHDWLRLYMDAEQRPDAIKNLFVRRLRASCEALGFDRDPAEEWDAYIAGLYGACLRDVTPENIVAKERLVARVERWLVDAAPSDRDWCAQLRVDVEALDGVTRKFAQCDRVRFGKRTSRDRLIDDVRRAYPQVFAD